MSEGNSLSAREREEVRSLYMRLHKLYPRLGYDRDAREGFPANAGWGDLESLKREVEYEEERSAAYEGGPPRGEYDRMMDDFGCLSEDLYYVKECGRDPDHLYDDPQHSGNKRLQGWVSRRPELESELDYLQKEARAGRHELTDHEKKMIEILRELRQAEARYRGRERGDDGDEYEREM